jgi:hypothetical protein
MGRLGLPERLRNRPLWLLGAALAVLEFVIAAAGGSFPVLSGLVLCVAPGLALVPLLPQAARRSWSAKLAAVPALGFAASSVLLVSMASSSITLTGTTIRLGLGGLIAAGLALPRDGEPRHELGYSEAFAVAGLLGAVLIGILLENRVIGRTPVPGDDWAQYVIYADEIRIHGALLIDNRLWMFGQPFRQDPGVPAVFGSFLSMTGQPASVLMHGIWVFAVMAILSVYSLVRTLWGALAGVIAAALWAVLPMAQDLLGWHGLANAAALALLPLVLLYVTCLLTRDVDRWEAVGLGLFMVALAAAHRLSFLVGVASVGVIVVLGLLGRDRLIVARRVGLAALAALVLCPGVAYDLITRSHRFHGTQGYKAYSATKVQFHLVVNDLTTTFAVAGALAAAAALVLALTRRDRSAVPFLATFAVVVALAYSWIVHFPLSYVRMAYYVPLALVPLVAFALTRLTRPRIAAIAGLALTVAIAIPAWGQARDVRNFYDFANPTTLRGLDAVTAQLRPGDVVVTDRCWSFLAEWLLHAQTLPALDPADILPKAEVVPARKARSILRGTPKGRGLAKRLGVRFLVVNPTCVSDNGRLERPPQLGTPLFVSSKLVVMKLVGARG